MVPFFLVSEKEIVLHRIVDAAKKQTTVFAKGAKIEIANSEIESKLKKIANSPVVFSAGTFRNIANNYYTRSMFLVIMSDGCFFMRPGGRPVGSARIGFRFFHAFFG